MIIIVPCLPHGLLSYLADASLSLSLSLKQQQPNETLLRLVFSFLLESLSCARPQGSGPQTLALLECPGVGAVLVFLMSRYGVRLKNVLF